MKSPRWRFNAGLSSCRLLERNFPNGPVDVFRTIVAAVAKHKDIQLVLSVGEQVDPERDRTGCEQCHHCQAGTPIGIAETGHGVYHPCWIEHGVGVSCSRCSAIGHPDHL